MKNIFKNIAYNFLAINILFSLVFPINVFAKTDTKLENLKNQEITSNVLKKTEYNSWLENVKNNIIQEEYNNFFLADRNSYLFNNRAQNLRSIIDSNFWTLKDRNENSNWFWTFSLDNLNRENNNYYNFNENKKRKIIAEANFLSIDKNILTEWYKNTEKGIEQGFTIKEKILGDNYLNLEAKINTNLILKSNSKEKIVFSNNNKEIEFSHLQVFDANNNILNSFFEYNEKNNVLSIKIDDSNAIYPITIDPIASSPSWTAESNQTNAYFGWSVSSAGDVNNDGYSDIIVGAWFYDVGGLTDAGKVFVYYGSASGLSETPDWVSLGDQAGASLGVSVSTAGDVNNDGYSDIIIGADYYTVNELTNTGKAFVYYGSASGLSETPDWTADGGQASAEFAYSVSSAGDVNGDGYSDVIIGAYKYDLGETNEGVAFVFHGSASGLSETPDWTVDSDQASASFGYSVSSAGDVNGDGFGDVLVGCPFFDNGQTNEGAVFVYHGSVSGLSTTTNWSTEINQADARFGSSISSAGDVNGDGYSDVIIGAFVFDNGQTNEGAAFVYHGSASGLSSSANWSIESNQASANLGVSVSDAGDVNGDGFGDVIIGANFYDEGESDEGVVFVYHGSASGLSSSANWSAGSNQTEARFGTVVSSAGDINGDGYSDILVGANYFDNGESNEGATFVYYGGSEKLNTIADWSKESDQANAYFGYKVSSAGDVNGDGYDDILVGAWYYDNGETNEGKVFLYYGSANGVSTIANWTAEGNQINAYFGKSISSAGDVNGDGYDDVIISSHKFDVGENIDVGKIFAYYGSASGLSEIPDWTLEGNQASAYFGDAISSAGDVNGDGYSDIIIGADYYDVGELANAGKVFVYYGSASGLSSTTYWSVEGNYSNEYVGTAISSAGDVNGDGLSDIIINVYDYIEEEANYFDSIHVYYGSASGLPETPDWFVYENQLNTNFGFSISSAGDVNGDGYSDILVGAFRYDNGETDEGRVFVYYGSASGLSVVADWTAESNQASANFGKSISSAGDVNADGYSDILVGAYKYDNGETDEGRVFVYYGSASGLSVVADWTAESNQASSEYGLSVSSVGDVNGDGYSDIIIGAEYYDNGQTNEGKTFVYYGNKGGLSKNYRQLNLENNIISNLAWSDSISSFKISAKAKSFTGRSNAKLQYEVKPYGDSFTGINLIESSNWHDTGINGTTITETVSGLYGGVRYHWRARFLYNDGIVKYFTPWFSASPNSWNEASLKTYPYTLVYSAGSNGALTGNTNQLVNYNENSSAVTAVPNATYHFVNWSDDSTQNPRTDLNIDSNLSVTANFSIDTFSVNYIAGENGTLSGHSSQTIDYGSDTSAVTAIPNATYHFVNWSDGSTQNPRTDANITSSLSFTANFALNDGGGTFMPVFTPIKIKNSDEKITVSDIEIKDCTLNFPNLENIKDIAISKTEDFSGIMWNKIFNNTFNLSENYKGIYFIKFNSIDGVSTDILEVNLNCEVKPEIITEKIENIIKEEVKENDICLSKYFDSNFKIGDSGLEIKDLQKFLNANGFLLASFGPGSLGNETEYFGNLSQKAFEKYKKSCGAQENRIENIEIKNNISCQLNNYLYIGSNGEEVKCLQEKLKNLGYFNYFNITGYFGSLTKEAVINFQKDKNLTPYPGWVGPGTRYILNNL
ncbi:MAG: FG-GAP-like repeat-containing protein [Patescibacteria group bacterium]